MPEDKKTPEDKKGPADNNRIELSANFQFRAAASASTPPAGAGATKCSASYRRPVLAPISDCVSKPPHLTDLPIGYKARQREPGDDLELPAHLDILGARIPVDIQHISSSGAVIEGAIEAEPGALATLTVDPIGSIDGLITWHAGDRCGFLFADPIDLTPPVAHQVRSDPTSAPRMNPVFAEMPNPLNEESIFVMADGDDLDRYVFELEESRSRLAPVATKREPQRGLVAGIGVLTLAGLATAFFVWSPDRRSSAAPFREQAVRTSAAQSEMQGTAGPSAEHAQREGARPRIAVRSQREATVDPASRSPARPTPLGPATMPERQPMGPARSELAAERDTKDFDPYAGRVARPLTGRSLQSALAADRLATKELNMRQLQKLEGDSFDQGTDAERSDAAERSAD
ncbi:hypothetical protein KRR38_28035 [Novosphingobium sp. G106]|uniref:hypothetical protein n=1 Tax=Novosphingobium sp. G106 TaxID=2849500 RepID=UPI001C2D1801|nr:hypothetical protein [Novosphingobium sp. G106]MBV1691430.1 hypothetical protein [Novosphingobium sp. G106]